MKVCAGRAYPASGRCLATLSATCESDHAPRDYPRPPRPRARLFFCFVNQVTWSWVAWAGSGQSRATSPLGDRPASRFKVRIYSTDTDLNFYYFTTMTSSYDVTPSMRTSSTSTTSAAKYKLFYITVIMIFIIHRNYRQRLRAWTSRARVGGISRRIVRDSPAHAPGWRPFCERLSLTTRLLPTSSRQNWLF